LSGVQWRPVSGLKGSLRIGRGVSYSRCTSAARAAQSSSIWPEERIISARQQLLPKRADPVAGALAGTIVFAALLATPVLIIALIVWMLVRGARSTPKPEGDPEFSSRFQELEEGILDAKRAAGPRRKD
jgi:hypothetical protein